MYVRYLVALLRGQAKAKNRGRPQQQLIISCSYFHKAGVTENGTISSTE